MRLDKLLTELNYGSRKNVKKIIKDKNVKINGEIITKDDFKVEEEKDEIEIFGKKVIYEKYIYLMLNKPKGYVCANTDGLNPTVFNLIRDEDFKKDEFTFGRLDKDTEGLLIISNDGMLGHMLLSPKHHVNKKYYVEFSGTLSQSKINKLESGILIDDEITKPAKYEPIEANKCYLNISEGKFHQVKKMFQAVGLEVTYLKRIEFKNISLDENLAPGEYRRLTEEEILSLRGKIIK